MSTGDDPSPVATDVDAAEPSSMSTGDVSNPVATDVDAAEPNPGSGSTRDEPGPTAGELDPAEPTPGPPLAHTAGVLLVTRVAEAALWPDPFARPARWGATWLATLRTPPTFDPAAPAFGWDGDPPAFNLVGHGLLGSELYYRPRRCGFSAAGSAVFAALASTAWEYGFEGNARAASAQDLVYTPLAGLLLGELRFRAVRDLGRRHRWLVPLLDPFGEAERRLGARC
jgi:hypothetical protein